MKDSKTEKIKDNVLRLSIREMKFHLKINQNSVERSSKGWRTPLPRRSTLINDIAKLTRQLFH